MAEGGEPARAHDGVQAGGEEGEDQHLDGEDEGEVVGREGQEEQDDDHGGPGEAERAGREPGQELDGRGGAGRAGVGPAEQAPGA